MKSECCHQHPGNGDLATQTPAQQEETDLREINDKLLAALEHMTRAAEKEQERLNKTVQQTEPPPEGGYWAKTTTVDFGTALTQARAAIEEARK